MPPIPHPQPAGSRPAGARAATSGRSVAVRAGGSWRVDPTLRDALLTPDGPPLARWADQGRLEAVKAGRHRTVWRAALPTGPGGADETFYLKIDHGGRWRRCAQHLLGPGRPFREAVAADRVRAAGVRTVATALVGRTPWRGVPEPLRVGPLAGAGPGPCGVLLTRDVGPAAPLADVLRAAAAGRVPPHCRRDLIVALARLAAELHRAGLFHADLHPGNLLISGLRARPGGGFDRDPAAPLEPALIDLHPLRVRRNWPGHARRVAASLATFAHGTAHAATAGDRVRFLKAHRSALGADAPGGSWRGWAGAVERRREAESRRRHARRDRHWRRGCTGFEIVGGDTGPARFVSALDAATAAALLADPAALDAARVLPLLGDDLHGPRVAPVRTLNCPPRVARAGWELGHALRRRGVPVAEPLLCMERPGHGRLVLAGERTAAAPTAAHRRAARRACELLHRWGFAADLANDRLTEAEFLFAPDGTAAFADPTRLRRRRRGERPAEPAFAAGSVPAEPAPLPFRRAA